jgi:hypothetical protein
MENFPDQLIGASLKPPAGWVGSASVPDFPDQLIGASLKQPVAFGGVQPPCNFPDQLIGASLKHLTPGNQLILLIK